MDNLQAAADEIENLRSRLRKAEQQIDGLDAVLRRIREAEERARVVGNRLQVCVDLVRAQAEDAGLWFQATTAAEAYLQQAIRNLHTAIEARGIETHPGRPPSPGIEKGI